MSRIPSQNRRVSQLPPQPFFLPQPGPAAGTPCPGHQHCIGVVLLARDLLVVQVWILILASAQVHVQLFVEIRLSLCLQYLRYLHFHIPWVFYN